MTKSRLLCALLVVPMVAVLAMGCGGDGGQTDVPSTEGAATPAETATGEATGAEGQTFEALKETYLAQATTLVSEWDQKLGALEEQINGMPDAVKQPLQEPFKALTDTRTVLGDRFTELQGAGEDTFGEKKTAFEETVSELTSGYEGLLGMIG